MTEKPNIMDCLMLTCYAKQEVKTYLLPLTNLQTQEMLNKDGRIIIDVSPKTLKLPKECNIAVTFTNDPTFLHAGDAGNLGNSVIRHTLTSAKLINDERIVYEGKNFKYEAWVTEKTEPSEYDTNYMRF